MNASADGSLCPDAALLGAWPQIHIFCLIDQHVIDDNQHVVPHSHCRSLGPPASGDSMILGGQIDVLGSGGGTGGFD